MGARTGAVDLLDAGEVAVAGLIDAHLRPRLEHPQQPGHQPFRHLPPPLRRCSRLGSPVQAVASASPPLAAASVSPRTVASLSSALTHRQPIGLAEKFMVGLCLGPTWAISLRPNTNSRLFVTGPSPLTTCVRALVAVCDEMNKTRYYLHMF
jgi:hypothetical protein